MVVATTIEEMRAARVNDFRGHSGPTESSGGMAARPVHDAAIIILVSATEVTWLAVILYALWRIL